MNEATTRTRRGRLAAALLGGFVIVLAGLYAVGWYLTGDRIPGGTTVAGVDIGGMSADSAQAELQSTLGPLSTAPLTLTYRGQRYEVDPAAAGLSWDVEQTVADAGAGRTWNPVRIVDQLFSDDSVSAPAVNVDTARLKTAISEVADPLRVDPQEPSISYAPNGRLIVSRPVAGADIDIEATAAALEAAYLGPESEVAIQANRVAPDIDLAEFRKALREVARPAVSGPIELKLPGRSIDLQVADYAGALSLAVRDGSLTPVIDADELAGEVRALASQLDTESVDATITLRNDKPTIVPARPGVTIDADEVAKAITPVLTETGAARSAKVGESTQQPDFTTADARDLGVDEVVSNFVTYFPYAEYRNINQGRAAELINGTLLKPGELFSFNDTVGERTEANGFVEGFIISNGVFAEELGGGVSQVVTTTYNAAFFAGLEDVEHKPHSFYIDRYPMGREATVAWPTVDLKFRNTTPYGVLIQAWVVPSTVSTSGEMHVRMWSTKYWDIQASLSEQYDFTSPATRYDSSDACVATTGYGGFEVDVTRTFRKPGSSAIVDREVDHVTYTPADSVICT